MTRPPDSIDALPSEGGLTSEELRAGQPEGLVETYLRALPRYPSPGTVLDGQWQVEQLLGEGGFSAVFSGRDLKLGRKVAIKVVRGRAKAATDASDMRLELARLTSERSRFLEEGRAMAKVMHPNVAGIYAVGEWPGESDDERTLIQSSCTTSSASDTSLTFPRT